MADDFDSLVAGLLSTPQDKGAKPPAADATGDKPPQDASPPAADDNTPDATDDGADDADKGDEPPAPTSDDDGDTGGEDHDDAGNEGDDTEPSYTVKDGDKEEAVKLSELRSGYMRQRDYTRKTQELATQRTAQESEATAMRDARGRYEAILGQLAERLGPENGERTEAQWNELRATKPEEYAREYTDFLRRQEQRGAIKKEQDRIREQRVQEDVKKLRDYVSGERAKLETHMPDFFDPVKGPKLKEGIRKLGIETYGFTEQELERTYDSRVLRMAKDAMQWNNHVAAQKAAKAKLDKAPPLNARAPGAKTQQTPKGKKAQQDAASMKRLEKTGSIDDALSLILTR